MGSPPGDGGLPTWPLCLYLALISSKDGAWSLGCNEAEIMTLDTVLLKIEWGH